MAISRLILPGACEKCGLNRPGVDEVADDRSAAFQAAGSAASSRRADEGRQDAARPTGKDAGAPVGVIGRASGSHVRLRL